MPCELFFFSWKCCWSRTKSQGFPLGFEELGPCLAGIQRKILQSIHRSQQRVQRVNKCDSAETERCFLWNLWANIISLIDAQGCKDTGRGVCRASSHSSAVGETPALGNCVCPLSAVVRWAVRIAGHADRPAAPADPPAAEGDAVWYHHRLLWQRKGNRSLPFLSPWEP